ncbi:MAG: cadherin-like domain-containing protein, partial [Saprospiraceae bacterium]
RLQEFNLEICSNIVLDQPYMVKNDTLKIHPGNKRTITKELLLAADNNNSASELVYTLVYAPSSGVLTFNGNPISAGARFTQEELNNAKISFEDTSEAEGSDYFSFTVADGQGGWIGITSFNILRDTDFVNASVDYSISQDIYVNPNPTNGDIQVILTGKAISLTNYAITDIAGRRLLSGLLTNGKTDISLNELSNGIYLLRMFDGKTVISKKIVKI